LNFLETRKWTTSHVIEWLSSIYDKGCHLSKYEDVFEAEEIDGTQLLGFNEKDFIKLGISLDHTRTVSKEKNRLLLAGFYFFILPKKNLIRRKLFSNIKFNIYVIMTNI
jgi:hypothetical protein